MRVQQCGLLRCRLCVLVMGHADRPLKSSTEKNGRTIYLYAAAVRVPIFRRLIDETHAQRHPALVTCALFFLVFQGKKASSYRIAYERGVPWTTFSACGDVCVTQLFFRPCLSTALKVHDTKVSSDGSCARANHSSNSSRAGFALSR